MCSIMNPTPMNFIAIMGAPGSGKTTFSQTKCLEMENCFPISCGDLYRNYHKLPKYQFLQDAKEQSKEAWITALHEFIILALIDEINAKSNIEGKVPQKLNFVIDGLWIDNLDSFQERIGKLEAIHYLKCDKKTSYQRLTNRARPDDFRKLKSRIENYYQREAEVLEQLDNNKHSIPIFYHV